MNKFILIILSQLFLVNFSVFPATKKLNARQILVLLKIKSPHCTAQLSNAMGKQILNLTNQYRAKLKLKSLKWNQHLANLARIHSIRMAEKKVPFGHAEFANRVNNYPPYRSAAENVALFYGYKQATLSKLAINGWIKSPGHRRNLIGNFNSCGIGIYKSPKGVWYFTQLFGNLK